MEAGWAKRDIWEAFLGLGWLVGWLVGWWVGRLVCLYRASHPLRGSAVRGQMLMIRCCAKRSLGTL